MEQSIEQNQFSSWAVVELMGHQKEVGFVTTQYYGAACMFKIDVPELPEREKTLKRPQWVGDILVPAGTVIVLPPEPGRSRMVGVSAVYALNPCDQETAMKVIEDAVGTHDIKIVSLAGCKQLPLVEVDTYEHVEREDPDPVPAAASTATDDDLPW